MFFETALSEFAHPFTFTFYQNSEAALVDLSQDDISKLDMLFLDWNMPKLTGKDCLTSIRTLRAYQSLPIIVYTTSNAQSDQRKAQELGAFRYLTKPSSVQELRKKIHELFSSYWKEHFRQDAPL